jgi:hypothetical protein
MSRAPDVIFPGDGWLGRYLDYARRGVHAPRIYHLACGLFCVSAAAGPDIGITVGAELLPLNLYMALLGPSGLAQKSRSIDRARPILRACKDNLLLSDEFSREALYKALAEDSHRVLIFREFGKYLKVSQREYMAGTTEFLTELYDCPPEQSRTLQGERYTIKRPYLGILTASTPEWLLPRMDQVDVQAGFHPRFAHITFEPKPPRCRDLTPWDQNQINRLVEDLHHLTKRPRTLTLGTGQAFYDQYEDELEAQASARGGNPLLAAFQARLPIQLLKFAACYQIAESDADVISTAALSRARLLVDYMFSSFSDIFLTRWAADPQDAKIQKVRELLRREPGITHSRLQRNSHLTARDLNQVLETLRQGEELDQKGGGKSGNERCYTLREPEKGK